MGNKLKTEHEEQREFVQWFRRIFSPRIFAIPNGGKRSASQGARLKAEGVSAGVPDLFIPEWHTFIEMKRLDGSPAPPQLDWLAYLKTCGYEVFVCRGCEEAQKVAMEIHEKLTKRGRK